MSRAWARHWHTLCFGPKMKFYMTPGSCSTGIHVLLEELDLFFEVHLVDLMAGDNLKRDYLAINPRGSVPTLVDDEGQSHTDFQSIAVWLAERHPRRGLLPKDEPARTRVLGLLDYAITAVHGEGFTRIFVAERYATDAAERAFVQREGRALVSRGFEQLERMLTGSIWVESEFSIADVGLFYVEFWADRIGLALPARLDRHYRAMLERPAARRVLGEEGYHSTLRKYPATA